MSWRLPSYRIADCCPSHCHNGNRDQPCWGQTTVVGEDGVGDDWYWVHACEGHAGIWDNQPYEPSPHPEDRAEPADDGL